MVLSQKIKQVRVTGHESQERRYSLWRFLPLFYFLFLGLPPPTLESSLGGIIEQRATSRHIEERNDFSKFPNWHSKRSVRHERRSCAISDTITRRSNGGPSTAQVGRQQKKKKKLSPSSLCFSSFVCLLSRIGAVIERRPHAVRYQKCWLCAPVVERKWIMK